jgi:hypothetical protein
MELNKIGILGCGWLGSKIANFFHNENWDVYTFNSKIENKVKYQKLGYQAFELNFYNQNLDFKDFFLIFKQLLFPFQWQELKI